VPSVVAILVAVLASGGAIADDRPSIKINLSAEEIFVGESVDYTIDVLNVADPSPPDLSQLKREFEIKSLGDQAHNSQSTTIINGRVSQRNTYGHVYQYRLTPKRAGELTIPGPLVEVNGKKITGGEATLTVLEPEQQDLVIAEISVDRDRIYPTQPFEVTLRILVRPLPNDPDRDPVTPLRRQPPHIDINWVELPAGLTGDEKSTWLQPLLAENGTGFTLNDIATRGGGFFETSRAAVFQLYKRRQTRDGLNGQPIDYHVYELTRLVTPERAGQFTFGPANVKGTFAARAKGDQYAGKRLVAIAPAFDLLVREVPSPRPPTFCGGIGEYRVAASASPTDLRVGDPLTLTLEFERSVRSGSLELISAPDLTAVPELANDFEIVDKNPTGRVAGDVKRFAYALRPKRAGVALPALSVALFDPVSESFTELRTKSIALKVTEASRLGAGELVGAPPASGTAEIKSRDQGIFQNVTDLAELKDQNISVALVAEIAAGTWALAGCLIVAVNRNRRKAGDVIWQRRQQARRNAERKLADARNSVHQGQQTAVALRGIRAAVVGLVADMRNVVGEGLTTAETDKLLSETAVSRETREEVRRLLESIEAAEYGTAADSESTAFLASAEALIPRLARDLERGV
jgi:hypothetical protein